MIRPYQTVVDQVEADKNNKFDEHYEESKYLI